MIESKLSSSSNCLQILNNSTLITFPSLSTKPQTLQETPKIRYKYITRSPNTRNQSPFTGNKSFSYLYSLTMHDMKVKEPSPPSLIKILNPDLYPKRKMIGKKLELVGKTVVSTNKALPKNKFSLPQTQVSNEYLKKLANVKSKYFCFNNEKSTADKKPLRKKLIRIPQDKIAQKTTIRQKSAQRDERNEIEIIPKKQKTFFKNRSIGLTAWEQDN